MNSCINFNSKDFKNFVKSTGLEESYAGYFVSKIQNRLNLQEMPTVDILLKHYNSISDAQCQVFQKDVFETVYSLYEWNQNYGHSLSEEDANRIFENLTKLGYKGMYKYQNTNGTFGITILKPFMDTNVLNGVDFEEYHTKRGARPITVDAYQKFINNEVNHDALLGRTFNIDNTWGKLVDKYESKYDIKIKGEKTKLDEHDRRLKYKVTEVTDLRVSRFLKSLNNNDLIDSDLPTTYQHYDFSVDSGKITIEEAIAANNAINDNSPIDKDLQNRIFSVCKKLGIEYYLDPKLGKSGTSIGNKIYINPNRLDYRTILHESIHAVTSYYVSLSDTALSKQPKYIQKAVSNIKTLHKELWDSWISKQDEEKLNIESMSPDVLQDYLYNNGVYFLYNPNELIAELSYKGTKKFINDYSKSKKENFFSRLWENILSFFRGESKQYHNLEKSLETLLSNYNDSLFNEIENTLEAKNLPDSNITLTEEQQNVVDVVSDYIKNPGEKRMITVSGQAGTGKTTIVNSIINQIKKSGYYSIGVSAVSNKAVGVLKSKIGENKASYNTLYKMMGAKVNQSEVQFDINPHQNLFKQFDVVFIDEASMLNDETVQKIGEYCRRFGTIVVFLGDYGQIRPIEKSKNSTTGKSVVFDPTKTDNVQSLTQRIRQGEGNPILNFSDYFYDISVLKTNNDPANFNTNATQITEQGAIITTSETKTVRDSIIEIFKNAKDRNKLTDVRIVTAVNDRVDYWNNLIHNKLFPESQNDYAVGGVITMDAPYENDGWQVQNSEDLTIVELPTDTIESENLGIEVRSIICEKSDGSLISLPIPATEKDSQKFNNLVQSLYERAITAVQNRKQKWLDYYSVKDSIAKFKLGYAITSHKAQGSTYDVTIVDSDAILHRGKDWGQVERAEMMYTAVTRSRNVTIVLNSNSPEYSEKPFVEINDNIENNKKQTLTVTPIQDSDKKATVIRTISDKSAAYGVQIINGSDAMKNNSESWQQQHPEGIVAYRKYGSRPATFTPNTVEEGWIGNPFSVDERGEDTVQKFYDWIVTGDNFGVDNATEDFRQAIIQKILNTPADSPILYYKELNRPSHATVIGYLIANKQLLQPRKTWIDKGTAESLGPDSIPASYTGMITPDANTIFVFGSNPKGIHGAGAAATAKHKFGAIQGQGEGLQGSAYALPTKDLDKAKNTRWYRPGPKEEAEVKEWYKNHSFSEIQNHPLNAERTMTPQQIIEGIQKLYNVAYQNPNKQFKVSHYPLGKLSLNGYLGEEMLTMFKQAGEIPSNIVFNKEWVDHWNEIEVSNTINQQEIEKSNEKPEPIILPEITTLIKTDGSFIIDKDDTEKSLSEKLTYTLNSRTIKPGNIIDVTSIKDPNLMAKLINFLNKQTNRCIYKYDDGIDTFNKLPEEWQRVLKENNINRVPKFSYLFTRQEIKIREEEDNIINSKLLKPSDLLEYSKTAVLQFSKALQALKTIPEANEYYFGDKYKDYSFIGNTTEEILNKVGLAYALDEIIKEGIFNPDNNDAILDNNTLADKLSLIYDNFRGFVNLSYDQFLNIEGIIIEDTSYNYVTENANVENRQDLESEEDVDSLAIAEEQGSALEHWQIGFRSVSVHQSMSQQLRSYLNTLLDLDENGLAKYNELGYPKTINPISVVDTILRLTQGSESLNKKDINGNYEKTSMVYKLRQYTKVYPYLKQLTDNYYPEGDPANTPIEGLLISNSPQVEQLQSLFYTTMQKNHQLYNILFNDNGNTRLKPINKDTYTQKLLDTLSDSLNNKDIGMLNSYDFKNKKWKTEKAEELKNSISTLSQNLSKNPYVDNKVLAPLQSALSFLNIEIQNTDVLQSLIVNTPISQLQKKVIDPLWYILKDISDNGDDLSYNLLNNKNRSNYNLLSIWLSPIMATEMQSMFYQDGKSYYSFVLPSYINKAVKKLKGETANWDDYMKKNYGNIEWFRTEDGGYLNYWLELIENNDKVRDNLEHSVLLSDYGIGYGDKTAAEYMSSIIASYFYNDTSDYALFRVGLLSNKPSEEYLKFQKITKNYEEEIVDKLFRYTFTQEVNRIMAVKERKKAASRGDELKKKFDSNTITDEELSEWDKTNRFTSNNLVSNLDSNGDKFHFLDFLNDDIENNTELGEKLKKYLNGDSSIEDMYNLPELLKARIENAIEKEYSVFKKDCVDNLVFTVDENGNYKTTDVATLKNLNLKNNTKLNEERLKEFFYNDYFAQVNMTQLFITDLALYKNTEDLQKRLAQLHAPSMKPNTEATINGEKISDGKFRTVYIKDAIIESKSVTNGLKLTVQNILKQSEDEGVSKNSIKYKQLKARLDNIVDAFSKVNWADAQGYTSPTAYRKRMAMFGKWSEREERAYKQLKEKGKISVEDLDILWQPLKPFGYSQVNIDGHNSYIPQFKIGVQNKNSEYLLIMADALLKGGKQNSKLSAIMDIMEESYDLDSTKGIDAIQFESTVKVGKKSVIDINNLKTAIDVKNTLKETLYINGRYNPEYVNEYDFEDYGIQQEVPSHFESRQQHGSQVRILSISDVACEDKNGKDRYITVNGETMTIREAKQEYMKAIADNINISTEEIVRIFKLGQSQLEKNKALSDIIREEIMRDSKYSPDLLWACSLNNDGEFNIPLSDPIHSVQIQQLLNSIIKNRIWKQKIAGGPVVQVSSFGLSEDLQVEYNKDGTVKCFQAYVPIYDENLIKDFMNDEGEIDIEKMKNNNPKLLEMMSYRIPTESKYSMVPIKVVGFLPRNAGEGIMLPAEITTLSGSDFDIDKLYIMRYEWDRDIDNEEVGILKKMVESEFDEKINSSDIREYFLGNENAIQNLNIKKLLNTFRHKVVKYSEPKNKRIANNNKIIDYSLSFLTSQYTLEQFVTPGNFDSVKEIGYKVAAVKNNSDIEYNDLNGKTIDEIKEKAYTKQSLLYANTQMSFYKQNSVAAKLIGAFAQANVSHAYINTHCDVIKQPAQIFVGIKDKEGDVVPGSGFTINGYLFEGWQSLDPEYEKALGNEYAVAPYLYDGDNRVSYYLASLLAASVDAVKDPVLNLMNINMDTVNVLITLLRLGVDLETSALFLSHPAVVDLTKKGGFRDGGFILDDQISNLSKFNTNSFTVNKEFLKEELSRNKENADISDIKNRDYVVLSTLQKIINVGKDVMKVTSATRYNSISSGVGPYATDTIVQELKTYDFSSNGNLSKGITNILRANNEKGNPILGSIYENAYSMVYGAFGNNFLQCSLSMFSALRKLKDILGYLNTDVAKKFADYFVSINQIADPEHSIFNVSDENRDYMLNDFPLSFKDLKNEYLKNNNNLLLESIMTDTDNLGNPILTLKTRGLSNDRIKELKNSWYELWKNDEDLAFALIEYNFFRGGFTYSPKTFMHLLPNNIKLELPNYIYNLKNSVFNLEMPDNIIDQFLILYDLVNKKANTEDELKDRQQSLEGDNYEIVKFGNDYVKITDSAIIPLPNLGGHNQAFEADPSRAVADMKSVIRKREQSLLHNGIEEVPDNSRSPEPPIDYIAKLLGEGYDRDSEAVLSKLKSTVSKASIQNMLMNAGMNNTQIKELQDRLAFALTNAKELNIEQIQNIFNDFSNILTNLNMCN